MYKIRLLILLLSSIFFFSCSTSKFDQKKKLNVGYIGGEYDGLLLSNQLMAYLSNFNLYDKKSIYQIEGKIKHSSNLFITNIDNTSDRKRVVSKIELQIYNRILNCYTFSYTDNTSQFYILAPSDKFMSNKSAMEKIKFENTDYLVKKFLNSITDRNFICNEKK
tara:strand:- start:1023 stop:1514 length:492 start_codon:yes stop_codon:yes gene_type:complete